MSLTENVPQGLNFGPMEEWKAQLNQLMYGNHQNKPIDFMLGVLHEFAQRGTWVNRYLHHLTSSFTWCKQVPQIMFLDID